MAHDGQSHIGNDRSATVELNTFQSDYKGLHMIRTRSVIAAAGAAIVSLAGIDAAIAACTKLAFSVNDYGKEGPTKDARNLLDKYIAKWTSDRGIKTYNVGPKEVTCELFLNFIVFDEHTCKAAALVCWDGPLPPGHVTEASENAPFVNNAAAKAPAKAPATGAAPQTISTGSVKPAAPATAPTAAPKAPAAAAAAPAKAVAPAIAPATVVAPTTPPAATGATTPPSGN